MKDHTLRTIQAHSLAEVEVYLAGLGLTDEDILGVLLL